MTTTVTATRPRTEIVYLSTDMKLESDRIERYENSAAYKFSNGKRFIRGNTKNKGPYEEVLNP